MSRKRKSDTARLSRSNTKRRKEATSGSVNIKQLHSGFWTSTNGKLGVFLTREEAELENENKQLRKYDNIHINRKHGVTLVQTCVTQIAPSFFFVEFPWFLILEGR